MGNHDDFPTDDWLREQLDPGLPPPEPFTGDVMKRINKSRRRRRLVLTAAAGAGLLAATPAMTSLWGWSTSLTGSVMASGIGTMALPAALYLGFTASLIGVSVVALLESG